MRDRQRPRPKRRRRGFTLVELLVVIFIILLVSAVSLPTVMPALNHRQVIEAARILQAALVGARDAAIRADEPRGIRLLPDPALTQPALGTFSTPGVAGTLSLAYNRIVPIEPAADYTEGFVSINPPHPIDPGAASFPPPYPYGPPVGTYPYIVPPLTAGLFGSVLMIEECPFYNDDDTLAIPNSPVSWFWNIRVGDKLRLNDSGRFYTVVGPLTIHPANPSTPGQNPELFVNVGPPGTTSPLLRDYPTFGAKPVEFLFLVNGQDDNGNGLVDEGWNGLDDWANAAGGGGTFGMSGVADDLLEWEIEAWLGPQTKAAAVAGSSAQPFVNQPYTITRRPIPTQGAREVQLPSDVVIDATTWQYLYNNPGGGGQTLSAPSQRERSRLPIDPNTLYADIMLDPNGQVVPTAQYSSPANQNNGPPFIHFWLAEREGVHQVGELWGFSQAPAPPNSPPVANPNPRFNPANNTNGFVLPLPAQTYANLAISPAPTLALTGERRLLSLFTRSGLITNNSIEANANPFYDTFLFNSGSNYVYTPSQVFSYAQSGGRESE